MSEPLAHRLARLDAMPRRFGAGATLFHQGDPVEVVHLIRRGEAHLVRLTTEGRELVLQRARDGDILAEASLFSDRYHCGAMAAADVETLAIPRAGLRAALAADPALAEAFASHLSRTVQRARQRAEILTLRTVAERLDAWLAVAAGDLPDRGGGVRLAAEIGVSPEALYREIARRRKIAR